MKLNWKVVWSSLTGIWRKIAHIDDSPDKIAKGFALGTFIGMTPFIGLHALISVLIARLLKWNSMAAGLAVFQVNLFTGAFVFAVNYAIGSALLGTGDELAFSVSSDLVSIDVLWGSGVLVLCSFLLGGAVTGIPASIVAYWCVLALVRRYRTRMKKVEIREMEVRPKPYALVTGASQGLGKALAREFAKRNFSLLLVSLPGEGLPEVCENLRTSFGVPVEYKELNLVDPDSVRTIVDWVGSRPLNILVNNAGVGGTCRFEQADRAKIESIIGVNVRSMVLLIWSLQKNLKISAPSYILNVSSMASFSPIAYKTVYPASKAFVTNFSLSLREELKESGISVSVMNPGPMKTNPDICRRIQSHSVVARWTTLSVDKVAAIGVRGVFSRKALIIPGFANRVERYLMALIPASIRVLLVSLPVKSELTVGSVAAMPHSG